MAYATTAELATFLGHAIDDQVEATRMLSRASEKVDAEIIGVVYATDGSGLPTDATVIAALKNAACAQVEYWLDNGDELGTLGKISSYSIEGTSVQFRGPMPALADRATDFLRVAGLLPSRQPIQIP